MIISLEKVLKAVPINFGAVLAFKKNYLCQKNIMRSKEESKLQKSCIKWFRYQYPQFNKLLFAVPNGGSRNALEAANLKLEGVTAGVSDLIFLYPTKKFPFLCIEMKSETGKQSPDQIIFMQNIRDIGGKYEVIRSFSQFCGLIDEYLK